MSPEQETYDNAHLTILHVVLEHRGEARERIGTIAQCPCLKAENTAVGQCQRSFSPVILHSTSNSLSGTWEIKKAQKLGLPS